MCFVFRFQQLYYLYSVQKMSAHDCSLFMNYCINIVKYYYYLKISTVIAQCFKPHFILHFQFEIALTEIPKWMGRHLFTFPVMSSPN